MLVLEIREFAKDNPEGKSVARLWLKRGKIEGEGSEILLKSLRRGVRGADGNLYKPKDGVGFLKAVQESYANSSRLAAKLVPEKS